MKRRTLALCLALAALVLALAACGGGDDGEPSGNGGGDGAALELVAGPGSELKFDQTSLEASAGEVTITMTNDGDLPHNVAIKGNGVDEKGEIVQNGGTSTVTATLEAGEYTFYCSVPGHEAGGMTGTLTVT
ncbi:MAG: plastocyanin/azurin family copper-binding protein [Gaiellaceae bacterium]|jgi:plastocyanin